MTVPTPELPDGPTWLADFWDRPLVPVTPELVRLEGSDRSLLYPGKSNALFAASGTGKTFVALAMCLDIIRGTGRPVVFLDCEGSLHDLLIRVRQLGGTREDAGRFAYWRLVDPVPVRAEQMVAFRVQHAPALFVLDGVTQSCTAEGIDADKDNNGYTRWYQQLERAVGADGMPTSPALLLIDHVSDKTGDGLYARGVTAKRDTITGIALKVDGRPASKERAAELSLVNAKSKHGETLGACVAKVRLVPSGQPDGSLSVTFHAPPAGQPPTDPTVELRRRILETLAKQPTSRRKLEAAVGGDAKLFRRVLEELIEDGQVGDATHLPKKSNYYPLTVIHDDAREGGVVPDAS